MRFWKRGDAGKAKKEKGESDRLALMSDIASIRAQRYEFARAFLAGESEDQEKEMQIMETIASECEEIQDLEMKYASAKDATEQIMKETEAEVADVEAAAAKASEDIAKLQKRVEMMKQDRAKGRAWADSDSQKSESTYATAINLLNERLKAAQTQLEMLQELIESYESQKFLKNPQAQDLYLQLRALLTAQEKELRSFLRPALAKSETTQ